MKNKANELADRLVDYHDSFLAKDCADMLRRLQAENEALKKENKELRAIAQRMAMAESDARKSLQNFKDYPHTALAKAMLTRVKEK